MGKASTLVDGMILFMFLLCALIVVGIFYVGYTIYEKESEKIREKED